MASLLEKSAAKNILEKLTKHDNYNVRWVALQQLFEVDQELACKILQAFQDDVHPFIAKKQKPNCELNASQLNASPQLRKQNRIKTITGTLAIEGNTLTEEQITAIVEGKPVPVACAS